MKTSVELRTRLRLLRSAYNPTSYSSPEGDLKVTEDWVNLVSGVIDVDEISPDALEAIDEMDSVGLGDTVNQQRVILETLHALFPGMNAAGKAKAVLMALGAKPEATSDVACQLRFGDASVLLECDEVEGRLRLTDPA